MLSKRFIKTFTCRIFVNQTILQRTLYIILTNTTAYKMREYDSNLPRGTALEFFDCLSET